MTLPARASDPKERRRAERNSANYRLALECHRARVVEIRPEDGCFGCFSAEACSGCFSAEACSALDALGILDGLLLTGGGDLDPQHYGRPSHPKTGQPEPARDQLELALAQAALDRGLPLLGICRGAQVLGVALGGQLVQDIDSEVPGAEEHSASDRGRVARHWVELAPDSRLAAIMGAPRMRVNSFHHQANSLLGPGVIRAAWSRDGVTEAVERGGAGFVFGVQWHPERMWRRAPRQRRLFGAFVDACREADRKQRG